MFDFFKPPEVQLVLAAGQGCLDKLRILLNNGVDPNAIADVQSNVRARDRHAPGAETALGRAGSCGDLRLVKELLRHGAEVDLEYGPARYTALHVACLAGAAEVVDCLLQAGANVNHVDRDGCSPLMASCRINHPSSLRLLLEAGAEIDHRDALGCSALMDATKCRHVELVELLLGAGAAVNLQDARGRTALMEACVTDGRLAGAAEADRIVGLLLAAGADRDLRSRLDETAMDIARRARRRTALELLSEGGPRRFRVVAAAPARRHPVSGQPLAPDRLRLV